MTRRIRRSLLSRLLSLSILLLVLGGTFMVLSPKLAEFLLFQPSQAHPGPPPLLLGIQGEDVSLECTDGVGIHGWWYEVPGGGTPPQGDGSHTAPGRPESPPAVLLVHGNAGDISNRISIAQGLLQEGVSVFLLEYRGYGGSEGKPSAEGLHLDALAGYEFLVERVGASDRVVVFGKSMGGSVAARLAAEVEVGAVILEASFTSLTAMGKEVYPFLPSILFRRLKGHFDTLENVPSVGAPILVIHGPDDEIVPFHMGETLFAAAQEPKEWMAVPGAGHNDVSWVGGDPYFQALAAFIREYTKGKPR